MVTRRDLKEYLSSRIPGVVHAHRLASYAFALAVGTSISILQRLQNEKFIFVDR